MPTGRPTKYRKKYCQTVTDLGKQGMSVVEMACEIGVARNTLETLWPEKHPEFMEAFTRAREHSQAWWERTGREGLQSKQFNSAIWSRSMAARFPRDWREGKREELRQSIEEVPVDQPKKLVDMPFCEMSPEQLAEATEKYFGITLDGHPAQFEEFVDFMSLRTLMD